MDTSMFDDKILTSYAVYGLHNQENVCYLNAMLQCLLSTELFNNRLLSIKEEDIDGSNVVGQYHLILMTIVNNYDKLDTKAFEKMSGAISLNPISFREVFFGDTPGIIQGMQQDSHEFLAEFFDKVHEILKKNLSKNKLKFMTMISKQPSIVDYIKTHKESSSIVSHIFTSQKCSVRYCNNCSHQNHTFEYHNCIPLILPNEKRCTIYQCFYNNYMVPELLEDYKCDKCSEVNTVQTMTKITMMPSVLIIVLKRHYNMNNQLGKNNVLVEFPLRGLNIYPYMEDGDILNSQKIYGSTDNTYNLYGVVNHMGSLGGGHYNAFCKKKGEWYGFDDEKVYYLDKTKMDIQKVLNSNHAYILFYKRTGRQPNV